MPYRMAMLLFTCLVAAACASGGARNPYGPYGGRAAALEELGRLSPDERQQLLELSPEDRQWAVEHPEAARELGKMSPESREELRQRFESLPPEVQKEVRENPDGYLP
ncbi:MAG: hypothetical protein ACREQY_00420 [Candidatus Binatia bacterium]